MREWFLPILITGVLFLIVIAEVVIIAKQGSTIETVQNQENEQANSSLIEVDVNATISFIQTSFDLTVITEIPSVTQVEAIVASIVNFAHDNEEYTPALVESVQHLLAKMHKMGSKYLKERYEYGHLQQVESQAEDGMGYLEFIYEQNDTASFNQSIFEFMEVCKVDGGVLQSIQTINMHLEQTLLEYSEYLYIINMPMNTLKYKILFTLHRLTFVYLFQQHLQMRFSNETYEEFQDNIAKLKVELEYFRSTADRVMRDVCNNYAMKMLKPGSVVIEEDCEIDVIKMKAGSTGDEFWKGSQEDDGRQYFEATMQTAVALMGAIPEIGPIVAAVGPLIGLTMKDDANDKMTEMIYRGFQKMNAKLDKIEGILVSEIKMHIVREIESTAFTLMEYLGDIHKQTDPMHKNRTILDFLSQCEQRKPFSAIVELFGQMEEVLKTQWESDTKHSKTKINNLKERLFKCVNKLVYVHLYQQHLRVKFSNSTTKERDDRINQLDILLKGKGKEITSFLDQLARRNYWDGLKEGIAVLMNPPAQNLSATSNLVEQYVRDIYTSDKFCIITHLKTRDKIQGVCSGMFTKPECMIPHVEAYVNGDENNIFDFETDEFKIRIIRSQTVRNSTWTNFTTQFESVKARCDGPGAPCIAEGEHPFTAIFIPLVTESGKLDDKNIVRCRMPIYARMEDQYCMAWSHSERFRDTKCRGFAIPS